MPQSTASAWPALVDELNRLPRLKTTPIAAAHQRAMSVVPHGRYRALATGPASLSIPCYAERRYGGVADGELLMCAAAWRIDQSHRGHAGAGEARPALPDPALGIQADARAGLGASYPAAGAR